MVIRYIPFHPISIIFSLEKQFFLTFNSSAKIKSFVVLSKRNALVILFGCNCKNQFSLGCLWKMSSNNSSASVWSYFDKIQNEEKAKCRKCVTETKISCKGSSTSDLVKHLRGVHNMIDEFPVASGSGTKRSSEAALDNAPRKVQASMFNFVKRHLWPKSWPNCLPLMDFQLMLLPGVSLSDRQ